MVRVPGAPALIVSTYLAQAQRQESVAREHLGRCQHLLASSPRGPAGQGSLLVGAGRERRVCLRRCRRNVAADGFGSHRPCPDTRPLHDGFARREV